LREKAEDKQMAQCTHNDSREEDEARKKEVWLQLVEARQAAGLTQQELAQRLGVSQAQVARIEKRGYQGYTLKTLQRYVEALGGQYTLNITVRRTAL
jgi:DNA-binding XRE family transcriptional regulator